MTLRLAGVTVRYADTVAVEMVDLEVAAGECLSVLGPSGSGKSTLLRAICGLEPLAAGGIEWNGRDLADVPVHRRGFGLMFQDYVLFPHLDVARNVAFGLEMTGTPSAAIGARVAEALALVRLTGYERRLPAQLSGGEQQRVALARALAPQPSLLMLDEPLGALDRALRRSLLEELAEIVARLGLPVIYVTHDHEEALAIGDRVAVMRAGRIETVLPPDELWRRPPTEFVARFLGLTNIVDAQVRRGQAATAFGSFAIDTSIADGSHRLLLRPDAFRPAAEGGIPVIVRAAIFRGDHIVARVIAVAGAASPTMDVRVDWRQALRVGDELAVRVDPSAVIALPLP